MADTAHVDTFARDNLPPEDQWPAFRDGGTWSSLFNPAGLSNQLPWLIWLIALVTYDATDPVSGMPEFKVCAVSVARADEIWMEQVG